MYVIITHTRTRARAHTHTPWSNGQLHITWYALLVWLEWALKAKMVTSCPMTKKELKVFLCFLKCCMKTYFLVKSCKKDLFSTVYKNPKPHNWCQPYKALAWAAFLTLFFPKILIALQSSRERVAYNIITLCTAKAITNG